MGKDKRPHILLVEDEGTEAALAIEALASLVPSFNTHHVKSANEAIQFIRRATPYEEAPHIDLVLLDLNLPGQGGIHVLHDIRSDEKIRQLPIVVLSTSAHPNDIKQCYQLGASGYVQKPFEYNVFIESLNSICTYWLHTCVRA